jgi:hypothetical protein
VREGEVPRGVREGEVGTDLENDWMCAVSGRAHHRVTHNLGSLAAENVQSFIS